MACPTTYIMTDPRRRADEGMRGAEAVCSMHSQGSDLAVAALDESNAFSFVSTPSWMWPCFSTPAVRAIEVWSVIPAEIRARCAPHELVAAQYQRLAMGFSHSVHILMTINMRHSGGVLMASSKLLVNIPVRASVEQVQQECRALAAVITDENDGGGSEECWSQPRASRQHNGMSMMIVSMDVEQNCDWDLANAKTFLILLSLSEHGFIDI